MGMSQVQKAFIKPFSDNQVPYPSRKAGDSVNGKEAGN
jgi:hypothetical protein